MKIAFDISQAIYGTGVSVYTKNLVSSLVKLFPDDRFVLFGGSLRRTKELKSLAKKMGGTPVVFPFPPKLLDFVWNSLHVFPIEKLIGDFDVLHTSDWTEPPSKLPKVTTVHDLVPFKFPQTTTDEIKTAHRKRMAWVIRESKKIIAVSHSTKEDLIDTLKIPEDKIVVIHEGVEEKFKPQPLTIVDNIKRKYKIKGDYIFSLSTLEPRKNQVGLVEAFKLIREDNPDIQLIIGGRSGWGDKIQPVEGVSFLGFVDEADLPGLYSGASAFAMPSFYEGFGLPALQAMACGTPTVASNISSFPEVVGDAGVLVDPNSADKIAAGIVEAISKSGKYRKLGLEQAAKFTWDKAAKQTHKVYEEVLNSK